MATVISGSSLGISIHSLLAEGDHGAVTMRAPETQFQSTPFSRRETAKPANHFRPLLAKFCKLIFSFSFRARFFSLFQSERSLFPVRTSPAFPVRFLFAPARHTISTSSG